jgi:tetratricopeptide (TPR) repeat protein
MRQVLPNARVLAIASLLAGLAWAAPAFAQSTGMVRGKVVDAEGKPVEGATVVLEFQEGITRKYETKSNRRGEFMQIGLAPGRYLVTAQKEGLGAQQFEVRVGLGRAAEVNFVLAPGAGGAGAPDPKLVEALKTTFAAGVALSREGKHDEAIAKFKEALTITDKCYDCWYNIGIAYAQKKEYEQAEEAFKQAIALKPDYAEAYNGLANIYNAQKRFDEAAKASAEAAKHAAAAAGSGGSVDAVYNQGVILWNAGKVAEARQQFEQVIQMKPDHADAHYWLGMAKLNGGDIPGALGEMETYLKLAPEGQYAAQAKALLAQLKK